MENLALRCFRMLNSAFVLIVLLFLAGCTDHIETRFVNHCEQGGNSLNRCECTYKVVSQEVGNVDEEFVDFVADFAKWNVPVGGVPLEKSDMLLKYELSEEDFRDLSSIVGNIMLRALSACE